MPNVTPAGAVASLRWRYATKAFDATRTIPPETWDALEQSLVLAPSSFGLQPWKFIVITDPALKEELLPHSWNQRQVVDCSHYVVFAAPTEIGPGEVDAFLRRTADVRDAPLESLDGYRKVVLGFLDGLDAAARIDWSIRQIYIALGQLMTTAAFLEIDACPLEGFVPEAYDRILDLPGAKHTAAVCCALGFRHPSDKHAALPKVRFPRSEVVVPRQ
ncbi:MAG: NAD(P)H-dependent oxidoreductase [Akkermansiaceae bacterium]|nr:NAD(P)H-dependent oxidoreductase [Akkermansiaceae bacterium]NNM31185.1 NAD(P)H-dependent oxidoreductase [Akkermansiaceae bacterium]